MAAPQKEYIFKSRWLGLVKWMGNVKIRFFKGIFQTDDTKVANFLRNEKDVEEVKEPKPDKK